MEWRLEESGRGARILRAALFSLLSLAVGAPCSAQNAVDPNPDASAPYEEGGHLYTTFVVARLAGIDVQRSITLAWGSQVPDEKKAFNAIIGSVQSIVGSDFGKRLMTTLHSLMKPLCSSGERTSKRSSRQFSATARRTGKPA